MSGQALRYLPIEQLPDVTLCDVVLWDSRSGLQVKNRILEHEAAEWRADGTFTHFLLLPHETPSATQDRVAR